jgi:threonine synthase
MTLFASTRDASRTLGFSAALEQGLSRDGGLFVPVTMPALGAAEFAGAETLPEIAQRLLAPLVGDTDPLSGSLAALCAEVFASPAPLVPLTADGRLNVLELFHGPTAAFKDFGARFLAASFARLRAPSAPPLTILVATSGDTGGAVAAAFFGRPGIEVAVLFPRGLVSPTQERQLTCWGGNVRSLAVRGTFDDCQRLVKAAFLDPELKARSALSSANSINLGRLAPQMAYFASASLTVWRTHGERASFVVPSGNLGNVMGCLWARAIGLPIADVVLAHNANRTIPDYLESGVWRPRASVATLASAMDVGDPSNAERLRALYPRFEDLRAAVRAVSISDEEIRASIRSGFQSLGQIWCPHTAAAAAACEQLPRQQRRAGRWVIVATAHPAKFPEIVAPLIGRPVPVPETLAQLFARRTQYVEIDPELRALRAALQGDPT